MCTQLVTAGMTILNIHIARVRHAFFMQPSTWESVKTYIKGIDAIRKYISDRMLRMIYRRRESGYRYIHNVYIIKSLCDLQDRFLRIFYFLSHAYAIHISVD